MSTVIAMAYAQYGPVMHLSNSARHLEEIRRVTSRLSELVTESERARLDLQMLFGVHVFSRAKVVPDLAISRGEEAHRAAQAAGRPVHRVPRRRRRGDDACSSWATSTGRSGGSAWRRRAASMAPSRTRSRQLETWRGIARAAAGDVEGMRRHLERAVALATESGRASARCEALARLAIEAARLVGTGRPMARGPDGGAPDPALDRSSSSVRRPR